MILREDVRRMHTVVQNSKIETAELCVSFGKLANDWSETVKEINAMHDKQTKEYERRIKALEKTNEQLVKENEEMKKVIADFKKMESEFEEQKRILRLGQIAFKLEELVSECVFPGEDRASKRARYGTNLKSLKALSHGAIFLAACNAIRLLVDVKLANTRFHDSLLIYS